MDCNVTCGNVGFWGLGVVSFGCIGEILSCVVFTIVSTISPLMVSNLAAQRGLKKGFF